MAGRSAKPPQAMIARARAVMARAYAPYSRFRVGAVLRGANGRFYAGCNVENAAYPLGNCAEASAIAAMIAGGGKRIARILTIGPGRTPVTPCGGCRQRIREFAALDTPVTSLGTEGEPLETTIGALLPHSFGPEFLGK
jgi:cytidine deaminase